METLGPLKDSVKRKGMTRMRLQETAEAVTKGYRTGRRKDRVHPYGTQRYENTCGLKMSN